MSEGYSLEDSRGEIVGIVVRQKGDRGFRFHAAIGRYDALDGHLFATPIAAQKAVRDFATTKKTKARQFAAEAA
jgi:hypothetical protein